MEDEETVACGAQDGDVVLADVARGLRHHRPLLFVTLLVAACSISYELLLAHSLALLAANALTWYSLVIGCFLLGMGGGSLLYDHFIHSSLVGENQIWNSLRNLEIVLSLTGFLAVPLLHGSHSIYAYLDFWGYTDGGLVLFFGTSLGLSLLIGILSGIELPLLISAGKCSSGTESTTNAVLAFDYFGSLVGAVVFALVLLPNLSTMVVGTLVASLNLGAASLVTFWFIKEKGTGVIRLANFTLLFLFSMFFLFESQIDQFFLKRYYCYRLLSRSLSEYFSSGNQYPDILRVRSPYQRIDLIHDLEGDGTDPFVQGFSEKFTKDPSWPHNRLLFLNGDWQFHSNHEEIYHEWFAHVPIMKSGKVPVKVLVLGGGDGLLIRELLRHPQIATIQQVDLDHRLIELSKSNPTLLRMNKRSLLDDRVETIIGDGFQFVRNSRETYDAIYIDFPTPTDYELSKLYSREFYFFVRKRLNDRGFMVFDSVSTGSLTMPDGQGIQSLTEFNLWKEFDNTLRAAGFTRILPYNSNLGFSNENAKQLARSTYPEKEAVERVDSYVRIRQQGFILAGLPGTTFYGKYKSPPGPKLYALNSERYELAFKVQYPRSDEVDGAFVNSIFRPRLMVMPIWNARLPF